eukprot:PhF_6_TR36309/c0_g1_i2/m.53057
MQKASSPSFRKEDVNGMGITNSAASPNAEGRQKAAFVLADLDDELHTNQPKDASENPLNQFPRPSSRAASRSGTPETHARSASTHHLVLGAEEPQLPQIYNDTKPTSTDVKLQALPADETNNDVKHSEGSQKKLIIGCVVVLVIAAIIIGITVPLTQNSSPSPPGVITPPVSLSFLLGVSINQFNSSSFIAGLATALSLDSSQITINTVSPTTPLRVNVTVSPPSGSLMTSDSISLRLQQQPSFYAQNKVVAVVVNDYQVYYTMAPGQTTKSPLDTSIPTGVPTGTTSNFESINFTVAIPEATYDGTAIQSATKISPATLTGSDAATRADLAQQFLAIITNSDGRTFVTLAEMVAAIRSILGVTDNSLFVVDPSVQGTIVDYAFLENAFRVMPVKMKSLLLRLQSALQPKTYRHAHHALQATNANQKYEFFCIPEYLPKAFSCVQKNTGKLVSTSITMAQTPLFDTTERAEGIDYPNGFKGRTYNVDPLTNFGYYYGSNVTQDECISACRSLGECKGFSYGYWDRVPVCFLKKKLLGYNMVLAVPQCTDTTLYWSVWCQNRTVPTIPVPSCRVDILNRNILQRLQQLGYLSSNVALPTVMLNFTVTADMKTAIKSFKAVVSRAQSNNMGLISNQNESLFEGSYELFALFSLNVPTYVSFAVTSTTPYGFARVNRRIVDFYGNSDRMVAAPANSYKIFTGVNSGTNTNTSRLYTLIIPSTPEPCIRWCDRTPACTGFDYDSSSKTCWFMSINWARINVTLSASAKMSFYGNVNRTSLNYTSPPTVRPTGPMTYSYYPDVDTNSNNGRDMFVINNATVTPAQCQTWCDSNSLCTGFDYEINGGSKICWFTDGEWTTAGMTSSLPSASTSSFAKRWLDAACAGVPTSRRPADCMIIQADTNSDATIPRNSFTLLMPERTIVSNAEFISWLVDVLLVSGGGVDKIYRLFVPLNQSTDALKSKCPRVILGDSKYVDRVIIELVAPFVTDCGVSLIGARVGCPICSFRCDNGATCLESINICDGVAQCTDKTDETMCSRVITDPGCPFQCKSGKCIPMSRVGDCIKDCPAGDDELFGNDACKSADEECALKGGRIINQVCCIPGVTSDIACSTDPTTTSTPAPTPRATATSIPTPSPPTPAPPTPAPPTPAPPTPAPPTPAPPTPAPPTPAP